MKSNHTARLASALGAARKRLDARYPLAALELLLALPEEGALTYAEIRRVVSGLSHVALSRHVRLLAGRSSLRQSKSTPLISQRADAADERRMLVALTRQGRALQQAVVKAFNAPTRARSVTKSAASPSRARSASTGRPRSRRSKPVPKPRRR